MRTVYAVGALAELERLGLRKHVAAYSGSSGGALAMMCFATGNAVKAENQFVDVLANRRFIRPRRIRPVVDMDYVVREVIDGPIIPDFIDQVRDLPPSFVALTSSETGSPLAARLDGHGHVDDPRDVLVATTAIPILYGKPVRLSIGPCIDGALTDPIPLARLLMNCDVDAVLVVLTRPLGSSRSRSRGERMAIHLDRTIDAPLHRVLLAPNPLAAVTESALQVARWGRTPIWTIAPSDPQNLVGRTSVDRGDLIRSADMGARDARAIVQSLDFNR